MKNILIFTGCLIVVYAAAAIGTVYTIESIPVWYKTLNKPPLNPPNWIFGPVWTLLYTLMTAAVFLVIKKGFAAAGVKTAVFFFVIQLILNTLWSVFFFGMKNPLAGLVTIIAMLVFIFLTILLFHRISKPAAYLMIPYILWVSFAAYLNAGVFLLNK